LVARRTPYDVAVQNLIFEIILTGVKRVSRKRLIEANQISGLRQSYRSIVLGERCSCRWIQMHYLQFTMLINIG